MSGHEMHTLSNGRYCWAVCDCGWESPLMLTRVEASAAWAEHVCVRVARKAGR